MIWHRQAAVPSALALIIGADFGIRAAWCPAGKAVVLFSLGVALGGRWGRAASWLALGLLVGELESGPFLVPDPRAPVAVTLRITGPWERDDQVLRASAVGEWLRQGLEVERWGQRLIVQLPRRSRRPAARRIRVTGYLRRAPAAANGGRSRPGIWVLRTKSEIFVEARPAGWAGEAIGRIADGLRDRVTRRLERWEADEGGDGAILVRVLVLGRSRDLPRRWSRSLRSAGLAHLVALSGLHVGLLAGAGLLLCSAAPQAIRVVSPIVLVGMYLLLAGGRPSLERASLMLLAVVGAWWLGRPPQPVNTLAWVAASMVLCRPTLVQELGFQLTVAATAGILGLAPRLEHRWSRLPSALGKPLSVSIAAHIGVLPWSLSAFHLLTPLAPLWNLVAVPWAAVCLIVALGWVLLSLIAPPLVALCEPILDLLAQPLNLLGHLRPGLLTAIPVALDAWSSLALALLLTTSALSGRVVPSAATLGLCLVLILPGGRRANDPEMIVLDVGQGEAILLRDRGAAALVDGGGWQRADIAQRVLLGALARSGVRRLDAIILTHPDLDHCGGLVDLTSYLVVERLYTAPGWNRSPCVEELIARPGLEIRSLWRGESARIGRWRLQALHPAPGDRQGRNNRSLVLLAAAAGHRVLLTGDLESAGEAELLELPGPTLDDVQVLKIAHHGSSTSTSARWLDRVRPSLALISCGVANRYGHPSREVLERLAARRIPTLRTDLQGAVRVLLAPGQPLRIELPGEPRDRGP